MRTAAGNAALSVVIFGAYGLISGDGDNAVLYGLMCTVLYSKRDWRKARRADKRKENDDE
ncbi:hypothetical protein [Streptomyces sp. NPDC102360]|uniref:hypothetical protein n=1 Tax=Streptomyces sp. NPDC102360 TaxID=3366160 RepID=UPI00380CF94C